MMYFIKLTKYCKSISLQTDNLEQFEQWKKFIAKRCILRSFHQDFGVLKQIGKGNFARVYLGTNYSTNQQHAIKCFSKSALVAKNSQPHQGPASIQNEIYILHQLNHPYILNLDYVYETQNSVYLVTELVQGGPLFTKIKEVELLYQKNDIKILLNNLLLVVSELAKLNIVHRDLKPDNILLQNNENKYNIKVIDFGLAYQRTNDKQISLYSRCGTPGYVAPEILANQNQKLELGSKCDVFSLGILFYILLVGQQPFYNSDLKNIIRLNKLCLINFEVAELQKLENQLGNFKLFDIFDYQGLDLLKMMLKSNPEERISADEALMHPYFTSTEMKTSQNIQPLFVSLQRSQSIFAFKNFNQFQRNCSQLIIWKFKFLRFNQLFTEWRKLNCLKELARMKWLKFICNNNFLKVQMMEFNLQEIHFLLLLIILKLQEKKNLCFLKINKLSLTQSIVSKNFDYILYKS